MAEALSWEENQKSIEEEKLQERVDLARHLLEDPALLYRFVQAVEDQGLIGERRNAATIFLAFKSRVTDRPVNLVVKGPSGSGKTTVVDMVVMFEPEEFVHTFTSHSERSLVFSDKDFRHCFIYYQEASGMHRADGPGASILRSITSKGDIRYEVTIKDGNNGFKTQNIVKPGPVGLILTTVDPNLEQQLETRLLTLESLTTEEHSREVLRSIGMFMNGYRPTVDIEAWHSLSYAVSASVDVDVEYGEWLAARVQIYGPRVYRDFESLLRLVQASAILYQFQRPRTLDGRILANVADYGHVYTLLEPMFKSLQREGLTDEDVKIIDAVETLEKEATAKNSAVSQTRVALNLGVPRTTLSYRLRKMLDAGYLVNLNADMKGKAADYRKGLDTPGEKPALPLPDELAVEFPHLAGPWFDPLTGLCHNPPGVPSPDPSSSSLGTPVPRGEKPVEADSSGSSSSVAPDKTDDEVSARHKVMDMRGGTQKTFKPVEADEPDEQLRHLPPAHRKGMDGKPDELSGKNLGGKFCAAVEYITDEAKAKNLLAMMAKEPVIGLDLETTGLDPRAARIRLVQLSTPDTNVIIDAFMVNLEVLRPILTGGPTKVGHNLAFDLSRSTGRIGSRISASSRALV